MSGKKLLPIFLVVFIGLLGFSIILPLLPYYAESYGASPFTTGLLVAAYAAAQLIGAPILGRLSDRYGRRPILLISNAGTFFSLIMIGLAPNLSFLFLARILDGLTGGNISVAQAYITDITDSKNRSKGLGLIGAAFGLGFLFGPAAGGYLSNWGYSLPAFLAAGLSFICFLTILFFLPESHPREKQLEARANNAPRHVLLSPYALLDALRRPTIGPLLLTRFFYGFAFSTFETIFSLYAVTRFNFSAQTTGFILAYVGLLSIIVQGFLIGKLTHRYSEISLIWFMVTLLAIGSLGWAGAPNLTILLIVMIPVALAGGTLNTVINSAISQASPQEEAGGILGLSAALESFTRVIAPSLGGLLLEKLGTSAPGIFSALILIGLSYYVWLQLFKKTSKNSGPAAHFPLPPAG